MAGAHVTHVNVGRVRPLPVGTTVIGTAIDKHAVDDAVRVDVDGLVSDEHAHAEIHGGPERALYAFASEDYEYWSGELGRELRPGMFGENLTTRGIDVNAALIGEQWRIGEITVAVTGPRIPCSTFAAHVGIPGWPRRFGAVDRPGAYLRVVRTGLLRPGDDITVIARPGHDVTVSDTHRIYRRDRNEAARLADLPGLVSSLATWAGKRVRAGAA